MTKICLQMLKIRLTVDATECAPSGGKNSNHILLLSPAESLQVPSLMHFLLTFNFAAEEFLYLFTYS